MIAYLVNLATLIAIFGIAATSLNLLIGYAGIFSIAHAMFFGIGAYVAAQVALTFSADFLVAALAAAVAAAALSLCLALPALRVRGEYFVAASLGLQMMASTLFAEAHGFTGGVGGLVGIPPARILGFDVASPDAFLVLALACLALTLLAVRTLMRGSFGRSLMALRDSESAAEAFGKDVRALKTLAVVIGCFFVGIAGALFAFHMAFVNVESFTLEQSVVLMAMVIIGGAGTLTGPLVGVIALLSLPAALSFLPFIPSTQIGTVQQFIYGALMTLLMIFRPSGLVGLSRG
ncbi:branched-chain amino acid ABC transporter permease [Xanthobacter dioxanivorans]|uniref:Branched-chain amino acid ABC transporter permease n=1 Tax=Xanthobacter dioxanivorans TaxID=2528964 RepID=A0A974PNP1_9HYPH|nr:branched-chain amino acid ABC transporter permease [Xanthobacter dioxanivorans]QRG06957.1 branched-chain amino acid ABC transporter permease [Xanthobacter dioxanivorans]